MCNQCFILCSTEAQRAETNTTRFLQTPLTAFTDFKQLDLNFEKRGVFIPLVIVQKNPANK